MTDRYPATDGDVVIIGSLNADLVVRTQRHPQPGVHQPGIDAALGQRVDHGAVLLLLLHLGPDHDEVQHHEHQHQGQHAPERGHQVAAGGSGGCGLGEGRGNEQGNLQQKKKREGADPDARIVAAVGDEGAGPRGPAPSVA